MTFVKIAGMTGGGMLGVLVIAFFAAHAIEPNAEWLFGIGILGVVGAAIASRFM